MHELAPAEEVEDGQLWHLRILPILYVLGIQGLQEPLLGPSHCQIIPSLQRHSVWFVAEPLSQVMHSIASSVLAEPATQAWQLLPFQ